METALFEDHTDDGDETLHVLSMHDAGYRFLSSRSDFVEVTRKDTDGYQADDGRIGKSCSHDLAMG